MTDADITTIDEVDAGSYTVRVGHAEDGYAATVIDSGGSDLPNPRSVGGMLAMMHADTTDDDSDEVIAPAVTAPHKWVAVGLAIEAYEWREGGGSINTDTESVYSGASMVVDPSAADGRTAEEIANMTLGEVLRD